MENASKALLMAGGILIALMVIGALLLMFNQIGDYQKSQSSSVKDSQLAAFNQEFVKYTDSEIKGTDLISLANKIIDFNNKEGITNSVDYDKKMTLTIDMNNFVEKHGKNISDRKDCLFSSKSYTVSKDNTNKNDFYKIINYYSDLETKYGLKIMQLLSSNYYSIESGEKTISEIAGKTIVDKYNKEITEEKVAEYREYSEFKSSIFKCSANPEYDNGQIVRLSFKFIK